MDVRNSIELRRLVPESVLFVAESGIRCAADIQILRKAKADAVLIGETLMRAKDKKAALDALRGYAGDTDRTSAATGTESGEAT